MSDRFFVAAVNAASAGGILGAALLLTLAGPAGAREEPRAVEAAETAASEDLDQVLERLAKQEFDLARALESARLDLESARRRFESAQQRIDAEADPGQLLREEVAARRLQLETEQRVEKLLEGRIARVGAEKRSSSRLHDLARRAVPPETLAEWLSESERAVEELTREQTVKRGRLEEIRQDVGFTEARAGELPPSSSLVRWITAQARAVEKLARNYEEDLESIESARALEERLAAALARESERLPLSSRLRAVLHHLRAAWNYELTGSEQEPITPGKIVSALVIFLVGWLLARQLSGLMGERVFPRMRLEEGAARAFQSLVFYFLMLVVFLTSLRMVQIPLTAFAVVGGALAIGVGFGSQNVVNNFISGIILLVERPIKLNDLIDVEGVYGNVERIGLRSTRVRTGDNVHIIVPNAAFLEGKVINWTHADPRVRITISVGVTYGSPTREVERLLQQAVREQQGVLREPEPVVLFRDFGDNALSFETRFWIEMRTMLARLRIESEVRFRIDELFRQAGIVIAFPQRDVHLDSLSPVEVRLVEATPKGGGDDDRKA
jgi:small-conductance mechanosensitive channel